MDATETRVLRGRISYEDRVENTEIRRQAGVSEKNIIIDEEQTPAVTWSSLSERG